jgi:hypothetical protein
MPAESAPRALARLRVASARRLAGLRAGLPPLLISVLLALGPATAASASEPGWLQLSPDERQLLAPFREDWEVLDPAHRERLRRGAERYRDLSPEEQARLRERFERWREMSPEQRARIRERHERFRALPESEQEQILRARERFRALPPERREELREKWRKLSPEERQLRGWGSRRDTEGGPPGRDRGSEGRGPSTR